MGKHDEEHQKIKENSKRWESEDPFPDIEPALLHSGHIEKYIEETGMVFPFCPESTKSASLKVHVGRRVISWDDDRQLQSRCLRDGDMFELPENSIVFVETYETFRLPDYIAMRFNLKIDAVHKGLLLGTGPLVDPGYRGTLLIPLHNLTTNKYRFHYGEAFVWAEFTKVSRHKRWDSCNTDAETSGRYKPFPESKKDIKPHQYLANAHKGEIRSSIPEATRKAREDAERARFWSAATLIGVIAVFVSVLSVGSVVLSIVVDNYQRRINDLEERIETLER